MSDELISDAPAAYLAFPVYHFSCAVAATGLLHLSGHYSYYPFMGNLWSLLHEGVRLSLCCLGGGLAVGAFAWRKYYGSRRSLAIFAAVWGATCGAVAVRFDDFLMWTGTPDRYFLFSAGVALASLPAWGVFWRLTERARREATRVELKHLPPRDSRPEDAGDE
jgi:hypothetical protein